MSSLVFHPCKFVVLVCLLGFSASPAWAQEAIAPDDVVVVVDDVEYTAGQIDLLRKSLPANYQKGAALMDNGALIRVYAGLLGFAKKAEAEGLPDKEPFRTQLEFIRLDFFAQVFIRDLSKSITITEEEFQAYYDANRAQFEERSVSAIYIDYSLDPEKAPAVNGERPFSENEARLKAKDLVAQLREGADFAELAQQHSTDNTSAKKGRRFGQLQTRCEDPDPPQGCHLLARVRRVFRCQTAWRAVLYLPGNRRRCRADAEGQERHGRTDSGHETATKGH